jgi:hypothetical protein
MILLFSISWFDVLAQESVISKDIDDYKRQEHLEFSHPLITESISPDTKIRSTFLDTKAKDNMFSQTYVLEVEYALVPGFSIHLDVPYTVVNTTGNHSISSLDEIELTFKFANFAFESHNVLLGYGISFGLPTGNQTKGIGNDHIWNINPFFNGGIIWKRWEWTAYFIFSIPSNQSINENIQSALESRLTALYHISSRWEVLLEAGNVSQISHFYQNGNNYDLTEGIKFRPNPDKPWIMAIGARHPVFRNDEIKLQGIISVFYHFKD